MKIENSKGWTEVIITENCSTQEFLKIAGILQSSLEIFYQDKLSDMDSIYWDFLYNEKELTLHYNTYLGTSIFPKALKNSTTSDNQMVLDISKTLSDNLEKLNNPGNFVSKYFDPEPGHWGLRGDPYLWSDMKLKTVNRNTPTTVNEFEKLLHELFKELTGEEPQKGKNIYVKKYEITGMSKGMISSDFWLDTGFTLLIQRYTGTEMR